MIKVKHMFSFKNRTFQQIVQAIKNLKARYRGMVVSYKQCKIAAGLISGYVKVIYP